MSESPHAVALSSRDPDVLNQTLAELVDTAALLFELPDHAALPSPASAPHEASPAIGLAEAGTGRWLYLSSLFCRRLGFEREQLSGATAWDIVPEADRLRIPSISGTPPALPQTQITLLHRNQTPRSAQVRMLGPGHRHRAVGNAASSVPQVTKPIDEPLPLALAVVDAQGIVVAANAAWLKSGDAAIGGGSCCDVGFSCYASWEMAAQTAPTVFAPILEGLRAVLAGESSEFALEYSCPGPAGPRWFSLHVDVLAPEPGRWVIEILELTETKRAQEVAISTGRRNGLVLQAAPDGLCVVNLGGRVLQANPALSRLLGYSGRELLALGLWDFDQTLNPDNTGAWLQRTLRASTPGTETRYRRKGGTFREVEVRIQSLAPHESQCLLCSVRDITERVRKDAQTSVLLSMLDQAHESIVLRDVQGRVLYLNQGAERLFGWPAEEAVGQEVGPHAYQDPGDFVAAMRELEERGEWHGELSLRNKEGREVCVESWWTMIRNDGSRPNCVLAISADVTERKTLEAQLYRAQRLESLGVLASGLAHDLNNVLSPLVMGLPFLRSELPPEEREQLLSTLERSAQRAAGVVRQLQALGSGGRGATGPVDIRLLIQEIVRIMRETFHRAIRVQEELPVSLWRVKGNPTELQQALLNVCVSARDAMPRGGALSVQAENVMLDGQFASMVRDARPGAHVRVRVEDTGRIGLAAGNPSPGAVEEPTNDGIALGLATVRGIVRNHGGFVRCEGRVGGGSAVEFFLPALNEPSTPLSLLVGPHSVPRAHGEKILLVDDEPDVRAATRRTLERHGFQVLEAGDGVEATALYAENLGQIRAMVTDIMMPGMDGTVICQAVRRMDPDACILVSTGLPPGGETDSLLASLAGVGVTQVLIKPHTGEVLLRTLGEMLMGSPGLAGAIAEPAPAVA